MQGFSSGMLRHVMDVETATIARDSVGEPIETWASVAEVRVACESLTGKELLIGQQVNAAADTKITARYHPLITAEARMRWGSRIFDINHVNNIQNRNRWLVLTCQELR